MAAQLHGRFVFRHAVTRMGECIDEALAAAGRTKDDIAMVIPHQANLRINQLVAMGLGFGEERMANNIDRYGNTTAATIPILLTETWEAGRLHEGDLVCIAAFGAGFTWGAALYVSVGRVAIDLRTSVGDLEFATPVIAASGTFGYGVEYDGLVDWAMVGGVSVKGLSADPSTGHSAPRMVETPGGMLNAIGLQNIGVAAFVRDKLPRLRSYGPRVIVNCWGNTTPDFERVVDALEGVEGIDALELNLSCPHKHEWGGVLAADPKLTAAVLGAVRRRTRRRLWVKLSPNVTDITEIAKVVEGEGADAVTLVNTLRGLVVDIEKRRPALANGAGGLSGPAIKPVALYMVWQTARTVRIPVVGAGGIISGRDAVEFLMAGARAVEVGTASLYEPNAVARIAGEVGEIVSALGETSVASIIGSLQA